MLDALAINCARIATAEECPNRGIFSAPGARRSRCVEELRISGRLPDCPTTSVCHPLEPKRNREAEGGRAVHGVSPRKIHLLIVSLAGRQSIGSIHFERFLKGRVQVFNQLLTGLALRVYARYFLHPADPPAVRLLDDCGIISSHQAPILRKSKAIQGLPASYRGQRRKQA